MKILYLRAIWCHSFPRSDNSRFSNTFHNFVFLIPKCLNICESKYFYNHHSSLHLLEWLLHDAFQQSRQELPMQKTTIIEFSFDMLVGRLVLQYRMKKSIKKKGGGYEKKAFMLVQHLPKVHEDPRDPVRRWFPAFQGCQGGQGDLVFQPDPWVK